MNLTEAEKLKLAEIITAAAGNTSLAVTQAYEAGILEGAMRAARSIALAQANTNTNTSNANAGGGGDDDEKEDSKLSASDRAALQRLGINPDKKFWLRNSQFTIIGYRPSRWKFPISVVTQNGARYKMTVQQVVNSQK